MSKFLVIHTDPKVLPLGAETEALLESVGASLASLGTGDEAFLSMAPQADAVAAAFDQNKKVEARRRTFVVSDRLLKQVFPNG